MELLDGSSLLTDNLESVMSHTKRPTCSGCGRPKGSACWCSEVPDPPVSIGKHKVLIVQHPSEERRRLKTAPMLCRGLEPGACEVIVAKKCAGDSWDSARARWKPHQWIVLYPTDDACAVEEIDPSLPHVVVLLDGTWPQARSMYAKSTVFKEPGSAIRAVKISSEFLSEYVIRTQPTNSCLSTVEAGAALLAALTGDPSVKDALVAPLRLLVNCQLSHGAVEHFTNQQRVVTSRLTDIPKRTKRKLKKCGFDVNKSVVPSCAPDL